MTCPVCERRAAQEQKAGAECKHEVKRLQSHSQRLAILVAVLSTLIGQEAFERAFAIFGAIDTLAAAEKQPEGNAATKTAKATEEKQHSQNEFSRHSQTLLQYVPPVLPTLRRVDSTNVFGIDWDDEGEQVMVPSLGSGTFFASGLFLIPNRKRK